MIVLGILLLATVGLFLPALLAYAILHVIDKGTLHTEDGVVDRHDDPVAFWGLVGIMVAALLGLIALDVYLAFLLVARAAGTSSATS